MQDRGPYYYHPLCSQRSEEGQLNDSPPALGGLQPAPPWDALQLGMGQVHPLSMPGQSLAALFRVNQAVITHFITRRVVSGPPPPYRTMPKPMRYDSIVNDILYIVNDIEWSPAITPQTVF